MDFGKFLFERTKKEREARKAQTKIEVKEIRLRPKTNEHHRSFKMRDARRWLLEGIKVRVTVRFRGREITYPELALEDLRARLVRPDFARAWERGLTFSLEQALAYARG